MNVASNGRRVTGAQERRELPWTDCAVASWSFLQTSGGNGSLLNSSEAAFGPEPTEQFQTPAMSQLPPGISVPDSRSTCVVGEIWKGYELGVNNATGAGRIQWTCHY